MKSYVSISSSKKDIPIGEKVFVFEKLDGSLIRAEWSKKDGFYKFGSKNQLLDSSQVFLLSAPNLIKEKYEKEIERIFGLRKIERAICYFEFFGASSFAGWHEMNEEHDVVLFDVDVYKKGLLPPKDLTTLFAQNLLPKYCEIVLTEDIIEEIRSGNFAVASFEGVVIKWQNKNRVDMVKIKCDCWLDKLREKCGNNKAMFEKLK